MACGSGGCGDPRMPCAPPVNLNHNSNSSSPGMRIQNGRLMRAQRYRPRFSPFLHRVSRLVQHPGQVTFRELCIIILGIYALYRGYFAASNIQFLLFEQNVGDLCLWRSFAGCGWVILWDVLGLLGRWAGEVIPWVFVVALVVFFGEEFVLKRKGWRGEWEVFSGGNGVDDVAKDERGWYGSVSLDGGQVISLWDGSRDGSYLGFPKLFLSLCTLHFFFRAYGPNISLKELKPPILIHESE